MEGSILQGLKCLHYHGDLSEKSHLNEAIHSTEISRAFVQLVYWLVSELKTYCQLGEKVSGDLESFPLELKGVLRELECPYHDVIGGDGIHTAKGKLFTLDYLITELQACRMNFAKSAGASDSMMELDTPISRSLLAMIETLKLQVPTSLPQLFSNLQDAVKSKIGGIVQEPLLQKDLTPSQWVKVNQINDAMCQEYKTRRQVLIKRVDVTIQSFSWSDKVKKSPEKAAELYHPVRSELSSDSLISMVDVLAARIDFYPVEKTSSGQVREATKCDLNKVRIGQVPDRGGRPSKVAPPVEMPKFQKRVADQPRGRGRGGGGKGGNRGGDRSGGGNYGDRGGGGGWKGGRGSGNYDHQRRGGGGQKMYYS